MTQQVCKIFKRKAYTLAEMLVALGVFSVVSVLIFTSIQMLGKRFQQINSMIIGREKLSNIVASLYTYSNRSVRVFFYDGNDQVNYDQAYPYTDYNENNNHCLDELIFMKDDTARTEASLKYDKDNYRLLWIRNLSQPNDYEVILENVYRRDVTWKTDPDHLGEVDDPGKQPVFAFPYNTSNFYFDGASAEPRFFSIDFIYQISDVYLVDDKPYTVPVKVMFQVNAAGVQP